MKEESAGGEWRVEHSPQMLVNEDKVTNWYGWQLHRQACTPWCRSKPLQHNWWLHNVDSMPDRSASLWYQLNIDQRWIKSRISAIQKSHELSEYYCPWTKKGVWVGWPHTGITLILLALLSTDHENWRKKTVSSVICIYDQNEHINVPHFTSGIREATVILLVAS